MKKFISFLSCALFLVGLSCCGSPSSLGNSPAGKKTQALKYNDNLVKYQDSVVKKIYALNDALRRQDPREIQDKLTELQEEIETSADTVSRIGGFEGDTSLRDAFLEQLEFYESFYNEEGRDLIERFIEDSAAKDIKALSKKFNDRLNTEGEKVENKLIRAQHVFLKKYKLKR